MTDQHNTAATVTDERIFEIAEMTGLLGPLSRVGESYDAVIRFARALLAQPVQVDTSQTLYECVGKHLYQIKQTSCDCLQNPSNQYREWVAQPVQEPNLSDKSVQKRLATQWGYVPAPVEVQPKPQPMTDGAKRALISNFFADGWAQDQAMNLLHDYDLRHDITSTKEAT